jgi:hypothetical protein
MNYQLYTFNSPLSIVCAPLATEVVSSAIRSEIRYGVATTGHCLNHDFLDYDDSRDCIPGGATCRPNHDNHINHINHHSDNETPAASILVIHNYSNLFTHKILAYETLLKID